MIQVYKGIAPHTVKSISRDEFVSAFDNIFDNFAREFMPNAYKDLGPGFFEKGAYPKCNVYEYEDKIKIVAEIPGLQKDQLSVEVEDGVLIIAGNKHNVSEDKEAKIIRQELKRSSFKRSFELADSLDGNDISAKFEDGVLSISIPKIEPERSTKKTVKIT